jgi:hypothetical protein
MGTYIQDEKGYYIFKDPQANLDYSNDWSSWLPAGDIVIISTWAGDTGVTLTSPSITGGTLTTTFIAGGIIGTEYRINNNITTSSGRIDERSFRLVIKEQ